MSEVTLEDRGRALENQFYDKENAEKLTALKDKMDAQRTKDELRKASGMADDAVLDKLVHLGLRGNTIAALSLVPLVQVAWADGAVQDNERVAILQGAHGKGLEAGSDGYALLETWLKKPPTDELFSAWEAYIKALASQLNDEQNRLLRNQIVGFAKMVAASAGGSRHRQGVGVGGESAPPHRSRVRALSVRRPAAVRAHGRQGRAGRARHDGVRRRRRRSNRG